METFENQPVFGDSLPKVEAQNFIGLEKKYLIQILIFRTIVAVVFLAAGVLFYVFANDAPFHKLLLSIPLAAMGLLMIALGYFGFFNKGYALRQRDVSYREGLFFRTLTTVPLTRVQHSELVRGPLDRLMGLASVKMYTAGGSTSDLVIPGLLNETAEQVREFINKKIEENAQP